MHTLTLDISSSNELQNLRNINLTATVTNEDINDIFLMQEPLFNVRYKPAPRFYTICTPEDLVHWPVDKADYWDCSRFYRTSIANFTATSIKKIEYIRSTTPEFVSYLYTQIHKLETLNLDETVTIGEDKQLTLAIYSQNAKVGNAGYVNWRLYIEARDSDDNPYPLFLLKNNNFAGIRSPIDGKKETNTSSSNSSSENGEDNINLQSNSSSSSSGSSGEGQEEGEIVTDYYDISYNLDIMLETTVQKNIVLAKIKEQVGYYLTLLTWQENNL